MLFRSTDSVGDPEINRTLSKDRADAVMQQLVGAGVEAGRVEARGFGDTKPVASNDDAAGRALNRRIQFVVVPR